MDCDNIEAYEGMSVKDFSTELVNKYCYGRKRYINRTVVTSDIAKLLSTFLKNNEIYEEECTHEIGYEIFHILMILKPEFIGVSRGLDERCKELDLTIPDVIATFLRSHMDHK